MELLSRPGINLGVCVSLFVTFFVAMLALCVLSGFAVDEALPLAGLQGSAWWWHLAGRLAIVPAQIGVIMIPTKPFLVWIRAIRAQQKRTPPSSGT